MNKIQQIQFQIVSIQKKSRMPGLNRLKASELSQSNKTRSDTRLATDGNGCTCRTFAGQNSNVNSGHQLKIRSTGLMTVGKFGLNPIVSITTAADTPRERRTYTTTKHCALPGCVNRVCGILSVQKRSLRNPNRIYYYTLERVMVKRF